MYPKKIFQGILVGLVFFELGNSLLNFNQEIITIILCSIGWYFITYNLLKVNTFYIPFKGSQKTMFNMYMVLVIVMIVRGYFISYNYQWLNWRGAVNYHLFSPDYFLPYFLPLLLFIGSKQIEFKTLVKFNYLFNFLFIIFFVINIKTIMQESAIGAFYNDQSYNGLASPTADFFISTSFFLLCREFISKTQWRFNLVVWFLAILIVTIGARRGATLMLLLLGLAASYMYVQSFNKKQKVLSISLIIIFSFALILFYNLSENSLFNYINSRGLEDTRSGVDEALLSQMDEWQLWFGKGLNGRYYYPTILDDYLKGWRYGSETGFFNLVLKGGYIFAILYILMLLIPAIKGIFKSKNNFTKALGLYIVLSLIELYPYGWFQFNIKFLIIWIGVVLCSKSSIRNMTNLDIKLKYF